MYQALPYPFLVEGSVEEKEHSYAEATEAEGLWII
jgi:hypothetical protein